MKDVTIAVRITEEQNKAIREICKKKKTILSLHLREMIDKFVEENKDKE